MKTILVDCINCFVDKETGLFQEMLELLEKYPNRKLVLTGANDEEMDKFSIHDLPYVLFTLKHNPDKKNPEYFKTLLENHGLTSEKVIYFEHNLEACESARSIGIITHHFDKDKKDLTALKEFLDKNL